MKKFTMFLSAMMLAFLLVASPVMAGAWGSIDVDTKAMAGAIDWDIETIPNGIAGGVSGAGGLAGANAEGFVLNGTVTGDVDAIGGGVTNTEAYRWHPGIGNKSIGVGSSSASMAVTGADVHISVDPGKRGFGMVGAEIYGVAGQGTLNGSALTESPRYFANTTGLTYGIAGQGSVGYFKGGAVAISDPDYRTVEYSGGEAGEPGYYQKVRPNGQMGRIKHFPNGHPTGESEWKFLGTEKIVTKVDSKAGAGVGANIEMEGNSYSNSYRFVDWGCGYTTEGMGTYVGTETLITSSKYNYDWENGLACSGSCVRGGWKAIGGATTKTVQTGAGGVGIASATGFYTGSGALGMNYNGSAYGYSGTQITTFNGMSGSIVRSSASMSVTSQVSRNNPDIY